MAEIYRQYKDKISLRGLCKLTSFSRWRLRYYLHAEQKRQERQTCLARERQQVNEVALKHKTYGYRGVYVELNKRYQLGREKVRRHMAELGLKKQLPKRKRKPAPEFSKICELPAGRKVQIDATRFELADGIAWKYVVEDVTSRTCLAVQTVRRLSQEAAATALCAAQHSLTKLGITDLLVVQSDAGSDFTSTHFQDTCDSLGASWHRSRINEKEGMGILERLNRTLKWDFVFWQDPETLEELHNLDADFKRWYNEERIHSAIGYQTPWQRLLQDAKLSTPVG
jgi:putative transposase